VPARVEMTLCDRNSRINSPRVRPQIAPIDHSAGRHARAARIRQRPLMSRRGGLTRSRVHNPASDAKRERYRNHRCRELALVPGIAPIRSEAPSRHSASLFDRT
jgi:hypothetical protein